MPYQRAAALITRWLRSLSSGRAATIASLQAFFLNNVK